MAVTLIAKKHRLPFTGFMWSEGHVAKTGDKSLYKQHLILSIPELNIGHARESVQSPLVISFN